MIKLAHLTVLSLVIFSLLVFSVACKTNDMPGYKADEIIPIAKNISPDCPAPEKGYCG